METQEETLKRIRFNEFLWGFANSLDIDRQKADEVWAAFSRQLSDSEREQIEQQGQDSGFEMGNECRKLDK